ncbi:5-formyltetrahydrofolate cyclo-ligase [Bacillus sp. CGMCC 1.16541]|uniref:5-formyltetrahydrofolate cyclo-ligase n=1 Tax=Bacillus sp. CGMCC 1.16541 TaxID=2185143 RepID=UPI001EF59B3D|nr:5-formyltetrahydrofolate cyclo-ligase [Bacillus sp. CGMCC 1.16541]
MATKAILRMKIKEKLNEISELTYKRRSIDIINLLCQSSYWKEANTIGVTISRGREVETNELIHRAWNEGKQVVVPKCDAKEKKMTFYKLTSFSQLETVYFGLQEPIVQQTERYLPTQIDLIITPGIVFDQKGYRIGYGGGYYDRYLASYNGEVIALAFSFQVTNKVPFEEHDLPVKAIITEKEIINCHD